MVVEQSNHARNSFSWSTRCSGKACRTQRSLYPAVPYWRRRRSNSESKAPANVLRRVSASKIGWSSEPAPRKRMRMRTPSDPLRVNSQLYSPGSSTKMAVDRSSPLSNATTAPARSSSASDRLRRCGRGCRLADLNSAISPSDASEIVVELHVGCIKQCSLYPAVDPRLQSI